MKARTKLQKQVSELIGKLAPITDIQTEWGFKNCFEAKGYKTKKHGISCLMCGHRYKDGSHELLTAIDGSVCPKCGTRLKVTHTKKQKDNQAAYYGIITTFQGFQVMRYFELAGYYRVDDPALLNCTEIVQLWMLPNGKYVTFAMLHTVNWYRDGWTGNMVIRKNEPSTYNINPFRIYPKMSVLPEIRRNGFRGKFHDINPFYLFKIILSNSKAETLLKARQIDMLKLAFRKHEGTLSEYWDSIKICLRNGYMIKEASMWTDYIDLLKEFAKDTHNAKYVCPVDLKAEHDRLVKKRNEMVARQKKEKKILEAVKYRKEFFKLKERFFDTCIADDIITIIPLKDPNEYVEEGIVLKHCVGSRSYYLNPKSLVLSARIDNKPVETIEVSLDTFEVLQCRGICNQNSEYHDKILSLLNRNIYQIQKLATGKTV
ncbi:MAG: PcfJ domain-containing protein [Tannerellaceae bacterium]|jgi:DNA-directed RNA polymerase subunit RPC12/RpoP|nr:PcfJ domain-containing protein [Tannerellaceae bacterium]